MKLAKGYLGITGVEIKRPTTETITSTAELVRDGKYFLALCNFVTSCIEGFEMDLENVTTKDRIKILTREMPIRSLYTLLVEILIFNDQHEEGTDDGIEGIYSCPRCGNEVICELKDGIDTRDHLKEFPINYDDSQSMEILLKTPVIIETGKNESVTINSLEMKYPTITDYIEMEARYGLKNESKIQINAYRKNITAINGAVADKQFLNLYGEKIFQNMYMPDMTAIAEKINQCGIQTTVNKVCNKCGKEWKEEVNTNNFFVSLLRLN